MQTLLHATCQARMDQGRNGHWRCNQASTGAVSPSELRLLHSTLFALRWNRQNLMTLMKAANCTEHHFHVDLHESDIKEKELFSVEDHTRYFR